MKKIFVHLENCYGIPKMEYIFEFGTASKAHLIYAPNGVMKTSFANTLNDICNNKESADCFYPDRKTLRYVKFDSSKGNDLTSNDILVIEPYKEHYESENISVLLANQKLKGEFDKLHEEISDKMNNLISKVNIMSGKRNSEEILAIDFGFSSKEVFDCLETIFMNQSDYEAIDYSFIKYGKLFTSDAEKLLVDTTFINQLQMYMNQYERLLSESNVFEAAFNHNSAEDVLKSLGKSGFFKARHKVILSNSDSSIDEKEFKKIIAEEKARIIDGELADEFSKIDSILSSKEGHKVLRDFVFENKDIIPELLDVQSLKRKIWFSYLVNNMALFQEAILNYQNNKKRLDEIVQVAKSETSKWNEVVSQFNDRFSNMPYKLTIKNRDDVVLRSQLPAISFEYKDRGQKTTVEKNELILHLSNGERKALYLLNIMFEIEARKELGASILLILDDVADSFDYRNKYAIIEYIKDIVDNDLFMLIILTHNFDFYRTVAGRTGIKSTSNFVTKSDEEVKLVHGQYFENVFKTWRNEVYSDDTVFLSSIAFIRNLVEYTKGCENVTYKNLTSLLHCKVKTDNGVMASESIMNSDIINWYKDEWGRDDTKFSQDLTQKTVDLLNKVAEDISGNPNEDIKIENKIVLSIAIRLKAEKYMISRINDDTYVSTIKENQTRLLREKISFDKMDKIDVLRQQIIERVLIITSENIHINSFMYEPIVDMSLQELIRLYKDVKQYLGD